LIIIYGAVILAFVEGRTPTIASIARYLQLPHETTRRYLKKIVDLGLLAKNGRGYNQRSALERASPTRPVKLNVC
jgi:DNA-binding IclR family transcriptional regulator